ncbi:IS3 family transposase [Streptomyces mutomycini]|uniref:IS3 family transposase n=1 Tax=Streptomyces mutomycini TaxID=284036 RepID=UPI0033D7B509
MGDTWPGLLRSGGEGCCSTQAASEGVPRGRRAGRAQPRARLTLEQIAADFGVHPITLSKWLRRADTDEGAKPAASGESAGLRQACKRIRLLEQENEVLRSAAVYFSQANLPARSCSWRRRCPLPGAGGSDMPGLGLARQLYYRWLARAATDAELTEVYRANALFDAHRDDPEFGHRFLLDETRPAGEVDGREDRLADLPGQRLVECLREAKGPREERQGRAPVHDDLVRRDCTADGPNRSWLTDITEHATGEGKLYLCAVKDVYSGRIVGYSIGPRMKPRLTAYGGRARVRRRPARRLRRAHRALRPRIAGRIQLIVATPRSRRWSEGCRPAAAQGSWVSRTDVVAGSADGRLA